MKKKIIISLSGGIDSSTTLLILKKTYIYIEAIFIKNWDDEKQCLYKKDLIHIKTLCKKYKIKLNFINFSDKYWSIIFINFINKLKKGLTPNPDTLCNQKIKFNIFLKYALKSLNYNFLATGHYGKIYKMKNKTYLKESLNLEKDQTYFLSTIKNNTFKNILFPITNYFKKNIKLILKYYNSLNKNKKNSTGICFIGKTNFKNFIKNYIPEKMGKILNDSNNYIDTHKGIHLYTIGEKITIKNEKYYILKKNVQKNIIYVKNNIKYINDHVYIKNIKNIKNKKLYQIKLMHQNKKYNCVIKNNRIIYKSINFLAPGQTIAFYDNNLIIGSAIIKN